MRIALIAMTEGGGGEGPSRLNVAGRTLAEHQLAFALALGCRKIVALGNGANPEGITLRHAAEAAGAQFQVVRGVRDLPATVRGDDRLLVLARGLLPESAAAFELLQDGSTMLVLPAEAGWSAGFERLDIAAAWGGAMVLPGRLVAALDQLPEDAEPIAGLLRIARQAGVPERALPEAELAEGRWLIVRSGDAARAIEPAWLRRRLPQAAAWAPTSWLAGVLVRRCAGSLLGRRRAPQTLVAAAGVGMLLAVLAGWFDLDALAFAALALAALAIEAAATLGYLAKPLFDAQATPSRPVSILRLVWDLALVATGAMAIDGSRAHRAFAPLVATGLLRTEDRARPAGWRTLPTDRGLVAVFLAVAGGFGLTEGAFMALALLLIAVRLLPADGERG